MVICKDCKHFRRDWFFTILPPWDGMRFARCARYDSPLGRGWYIYIARGFVSLCGPVGAWFEQKGNSK